MSDTMTGSIIFVQLEDSDHVTAFIAYGSGRPEDAQHRAEIRLDTPESIADCTDWMRQLLAATVEGL